MFSAGEVIKVDANRDGRIDASEFDAAVQNAELRNGDDPYLIIEINGMRLDYAQWNAMKDSLRGIYVSESGEGEPPVDQQITSAKAAVEQLAGEVANAEEFLARLKNEGADQTQIDQANQRLAELREALKNQIRQLELFNTRADKNASDGISARMYDLAGISPRGEGGAKATFAMTYGGDAGAGTGAKGTTTGTIPMGFTPPSGWAAQTAMPQFSTDAYMQSMMMEDNVLSSFDSVLKNENKGRQLMMLFFYFARMAESGDLGAMYQFMKFLTYIISKDKSKQQIDMGKKLIELQDLSRQWTDKLLGMQTNSADPNASNEFMKVMTQVKSETDAIATSQKLISQMMEEFAQIVETLTNTTKSALEASGRVLRTVSTMR
jgi:hypothetical protein